MMDREEEEAPTTTPPHTPPSAASSAVDVCADSQATRAHNTSTCPTGGESAKKKEEDDDATELTTVATAETTGTADDVATDGSTSRGVLNLGPPARIPTGRRGGGTSTRPPFTPAEPTGPSGVSDSGPERGAHDVVRHVNESEGSSAAATGAGAPPVATATPTATATSSSAATPNATSCTLSPVGATDDGGGGSPSAALSEFEKKDSQGRTFIPFSARKALQRQQQQQGPSSPAASPGGSAGSPATGGAGAAGDSGTRTRTTARVDTSKVVQRTAETHTSQLIDAVDYGCVRSLIDVVAGFNDYAAVRNLSTPLLASSSDAGSPPPAGSSTPRSSFRPESINVSPPPQAHHPPPTKGGVEEHSGVVRFTKEELGASLDCHCPLCRRGQEGAAGEDDNDDDGGNTKLKLSVQGRHRLMRCLLSGSRNDDYAVESGEKNTGKGCAESGSPFGLSDEAKVVFFRALFNRLTTEVPPAASPLRSPVASPLRSPVAFSSPLTTRGGAGDVTATSTAAGAQGSSPSLRRGFSTKGVGTTDDVLGTLHTRLRRMQLTSYFTPLPFAVEHTLLQYIMNFPVAVESATGARLLFIFLELLRALKNTPHLSLFAQGTKCSTSSGVDDHNNNRSGSTTVRPAVVVVLSAGTTDAGGSSLLTRADQGDLLDRSGEGGTQQRQDKEEAVLPFGFALAVDPVPGDEEKKEKKKEKAKKKKNDEKEPPAEPENEKEEAFHRLEAVVDLLSKPADSTIAYYRDSTAGPTEDEAATKKERMMTAPDEADDSVAVQSTWSYLLKQSIGVLFGVEPLAYHDQFVHNPTAAAVAVARTGGEAAGDVVDVDDTQRSIVGPLESLSTCSSTSTTWASVTHADYRPLPQNLAEKYSKATPWKKHAAVQVLSHLALHGDDEALCFLERLSEYPTLSSCLVLSKVFVNVFTAIQKHSLLYFTFSSADDDNAGSAGDVGSAVDSISAARTTAVQMLTLPQVVYAFPRLKGVLKPHAYVRILRLEDRLHSFLQPLERLVSEAEEQRRDEQYQGEEQAEEEEQRGDVAAGGVQGEEKVKDQEKKKKVRKIDFIPMKEMHPYHLSLVLRKIGLPAELYTLVEPFMAWRVPLRLLVQANLAHECVD